MTLRSWIHGLVGGLLISSCCIVQLFLNLFGIGCAGLNTLLLPYRPVFISLTIVSLTYAFYRSRPSAKQFLAVVTFTALLSFSPELLQSYNDHLSSVVDVKQSDHVQHWQIKGMHCEGCRSAVIQALKNLHSIEHVHVDLNNGRATISSHEKISKTDVIEKIKSAGFHAEFID